MITPVGIRMPPEGMIPIKANPIPQLIQVIQNKSSWKSLSLSPEEFARTTTTDEFVNVPIADSNIREIEPLKMLLRTFLMAHRKSPWKGLRIIDEKTWTKIAWSESSAESWMSNYLRWFLNNNPIMGATPLLSIDIRNLCEKLSECWNNQEEDIPAHLINSIRDTFGIYREQFPYIYRVDHLDRVIPVLPEIQQALVKSGKAKLKTGQRGSINPLEKEALGQPLEPTFLETIEEENVTIIHPRIREMAQVQRRIKQSPDGVAEVYFGVNDDGYLVEEKKKPEILKFAQQFHWELMAEGIFRVEYKFLTVNEFKNLQKKFNSFKENEEDHREFKSIGAAYSELAKKPTKSELRNPDRANWRVIQLTVRQTKGYTPKVEVINPPPGVPPRVEILFKRKEIEVETSSPAVAISRYRPSKVKPGMTPYQREKIQHDERSRIASFKALGECVRVVNIALSMARQVPSNWSLSDEKNRTKGVPRKRPLLRQYDLSKEDDAKMYQIQTEIIKEIIKEHELFGHDQTIDLIKEAAAEIRVMWQKGQIRDPKANKISKLLVQFIDLTKPQTNRGHTRIIMDNVEYYIPEYGMCVAGYIGRSLPKPSFEKVEKERMATYNRFRIPLEVNKTTRNQIMAWSNKYFEKIKEPMELQKKIPKTSATMERSGSMGGILGLLADLYAAVKGTPLEEIPSELTETIKWKIKNPEVKALVVGEYEERIQQMGAFCFAISLDILKPYLDHVDQCEGKKCKMFEKHLPLFPIGIPELGGKVRVPCLTTGLLNVIADPIRKAMYEIIRVDERCKYRARGATNENFLVKFFKSLADSDMVHSGDMTVSTDGFPEEFMKAVIDGMPISNQSKQIARLCCGKFRMIEPTADNEDDRLENQVHPLESIKRELFRSRTEYQPPKKLQEMLGINFIGNARVDPLMSYDDGQGIGLSNPRDVLADVSSTWGDGQPYVEYHYEEGETLKILVGMIRKNISTRYTGEYLTVRGLQMSTSCSIAFLYSYNLFCDTFAEYQKNSKGKSQLCGDDSIRAGNVQYIEAYKRKALELGSIFSAWKDVTASNQRGVFTELYFEEKEVLIIPKVKTVARPEGRKGIPAWKTAIQALGSLPKDLNHKIYLEEEIMSPHSAFLDNYGSMLPLFLPRRVGGMGAQGPKPSKFLMELWERTKSIQDKYVAFKYIHKFVEPLAVVPIKAYTAKPHIDPFVFIGPRSVQDRTGWGSGASKWLYLENNRLRALIEAAVALGQRPQQPFFDEGRLSVFRHEIAEGGKRYSISEGELPRLIREQAVRMQLLDATLPRTRDSAPSDEEFINQVYNTDVAKLLVNTVAGVN
jgi:hypothetical protein